MEFIARHCAPAYADLASAKKESFKRALQDSIKIDLDYCEKYPFCDDFSIVDGQQNDPPRITQPQEISVKFGFGLNDQNKFFLSLTRPKAYQFIREYTAIGKAKFDRQFTAKYYRDKFGRDPAFLPYRYGANRDPIMLLTYAEWIHLVGLGASPTLPSFQDP